MALGVTKPLVNVKVPFTVASTDPLKLTPVLLLMVRLLKVELEVPIICCALAPVNCIVLVDGVNVPLFSQFPLTEEVKVDAFKVVPEPIVILLLMVVIPRRVLVPLPLVFIAP